MNTCLHPINLNKEGSYRSIQRYSYNSLVVPCQDCENCRKQRSLEFTIRAYYDYLWFNSDALTGKKGFVMFDTLTYDDEHLPTYRLYGEEIPCFDRGDIKAFKSGFESKAIGLLFYLRKLPRNPENRTRIRTEVRTLLRTIVVSEYGSEHHRPHYHILVFNKIPEFTPAIVERLYMDSWTDGEYRMLGGVENVSPNLKVVEGLGKIIYVSGYVNKDQDFYRNEKKAQIKNLPRTEQNRFCPFNQTYRGFGKHIFDYYTEAQLLDPSTKVKLPNGDKGFRYERVPKYIMDSLIKDTYKYTIMENGVEKKMYSKRLNKRGVQFMRSVFRQRHKKFETDLDVLMQEGYHYDALTYSPMDTVVTSEDYQRTFSYCMKKWMDSVGVNLFTLSTYALLYRGRYGSRNPETEKSRSMQLCQFERHLRSVVTDVYYMDTENINKVYGTGVFHNKVYDQILHEFELFNTHLLQCADSKLNPIRESKKRFRTKKSKSRELKYY